MSRTRYRVDPFFRIPRAWTGRRRFEASCDAYRCPPFWITSLQRAAGHQESRLHGRCLRHAILSFSLAPLSLSLSLSFSPSTPYPATCDVLFFLLLSLALSHTPVDLLGGRSDRCTRQVFGQCSAPDFNLISNEVEAHFTKLTVTRCREINYKILPFCFELFRFKKFYFLSKFFSGNFFLIPKKQNL